MGAKSGSYTRLCKVRVMLLHLLSAMWRSTSATIVHGKLNSRDCLGQSPSLPLLLPSSLPSSSSSSSPPPLG
jgi:hypothetical protein